MRKRYRLGSIAAIAQAFGRARIEQWRSTLSFVPAAVASLRDTNVVVNPNYPDATQISVGRETAIALYGRLH